MTPFILKNSHIKKGYLQIPNIPMTTFILKIKKDTYKPQVSLQPPFTLKNNHIKKHTHESQNTWDSFLAYFLFQILKKEYLQILAQFFSYSLFKY